MYFLDVVRHINYNVLVHIGAEMFEVIVRQKYFALFHIILNDSTFFL